MFINVKHAFIFIMIKINEDHAIFSIVMFIAKKKFVIINTANILTINFNSCIILIGIKLNFANFMEVISKNANIKVFAHSPIPKTRSKEIYNFFIWYQIEILTFICINIKLYGALLLKSIFYNYFIVMKEISVYMPIIFKTIEEIQRCTNITQLDAMHGISKLK